MKINSVDYWNSRFEGDWDQKGGPRQTAAFARMFLLNMPDWLNRELSKGCSFCDWGCAEGDATGLMVESFPQSKFTGIDFASNAVDIASRRFPGLSFKCEDWNTDSRKKKTTYDCVYVSNVLEHYRNPYEILWKIIAPHAKKFIVLLLPYREFPPRRCAEHEYTFCRTNIPLGNATWQCVGFKVIDEIPDKVFQGMECMIVYARRDLKESPDIKISDVDGGAEFSRDLDRLEAEKNTLVEKVKAAEAQNQLRYEKDRQIIAANAALKEKIGTLDTSLKSEREEIEKLRKNLESANADLAEKRQALAKLIDERSQGRVNLTAEQEKVKDLNSKLTAIRNELATAKNEVLELRVNLDADRKVSSGQAEQITVLKAALQLAANRPQIEMNETRLLEYSQEVRELRTALEVKRDEAVSRAEQLGRLSGELQALKVERDALTRRVSELSSELGSKMEEVNESRNYARLCEEDNVNIESRNKELAEKLETITSEKTELEGRFSSLVDECASKDEAIGRIANERTELERESALLKGTLRDLKTECEALRHNLAAAESVDESTKEEIGAVTREKDNLSALLEKAQRENAQLRHAVADAKSDIEKADARHHDISLQLGEALKALDSLRKERDAESTKCMALRMERDGLKSTNTALSGKLNSTQSELDLVRAELAKERQTVKKAQDEKSVLEAAGKKAAEVQQKTIDAQKKEIAGLNGKLNSAQSELDITRSALAKERQTAKKAQDEKRVLEATDKKAAEVQQKTIDAQKKEISDREKENSSQKIKIEAFQKQSAELQKQIAESQKTLSTLRQAYADLKQAKTEAVRRHDVKATKLNNLTHSYTALANSKLGSLTLRYWRLKDRLLGRNDEKNNKQPETGTQTSRSSSVVPSNQSVQSAKLSAGGLLSKGDEEFFSRIEAKIAGMPESNGSRYYAKLPVKIGIICDQFYWDSVYSAADFVYIRPEAWKEDISGIDCLLMVSAWHGLRNGTDWQGLPYEGTKRRLLAYEIIDTCKSKGLPIIFYSKEDPPSYKEFLGIAKRCDYVFTSAEECVPAYKKDCGHDRVWVLRFCINPTYHNPVGMRYEKQKSGVIFSGSWMTKFPDRCKDLAMMFDGIMSTGREMRIIDRCYHLRSDERYRYPDKYLKWLSPAFGHKELQKVHKLYDWAVNINTVRDSRSMFANRVFELQASGNLLLSNYSLGVSNLFPTVFMPYDSKETARILDSFTPEEIYERQVSGIRRVMTNETCCVRLAEMLSLSGISVNVKNRHVVVVADKITDKVQMMFDCQTYRDKELICASELTDSVYEGADMVAFMADDYSYAPFYLEDMVNGFKYTDSDYVTKDAFVKHGRLEAGIEHDYVNVMKDKYRTVFWRSSFSRMRLLKIRGKVALPNGYSIDHFNLEIKKRKPKAFMPEVSVVIPVYNNGWYLYGRAFAALRRSSLFKKMEIIIVDDGSTDAFTPKMIKHLESLYSNVHSFFFGDGGSGTPSRPRNKGVKIAKSDFIIFHDPDNEAICDGYATLFSEMESEKLDVALGNTVRCDGKNMTFDYYSVVKHNNGNNVLVTDGRKALVSTTFLPANIQTMVIRKAFLEENGLEQVIGGIGEDSLLCNQMMLLAKRLKVYPVKVQIYYAERGDSIVNAVSENFFIKHKRTEIERVKWLRENALFDDYMRKRFAGYVRGWYFLKLASVAPENRAACCRKLLETLYLYGKGNPSGDSRIGEFIELASKGDYDKLFEDILLPVKQKAEMGYVTLLPEVKAFVLPMTKTFVYHSCATKGEAAVSLSGEIVTSTSEKPVVMRVMFEDADKKVVNTGKLPYSPKFGEHISLKNGAFHNSVKVPPRAKTLTLGFMRWETTDEVRVDKLKVTSL